MLMIISHEFSTYHGPLTFQCSEDNRYDLYYAVHISSNCCFTSDDACVEPELERGRF